MRGSFYIRGDEIKEVTIQWTDLLVKQLCSQHFMNAKVTSSPWLPEYELYGLENALIVLPVHFKCKSISLLRLGFGLQCWVLEGQKLSCSLSL